MRLRPYAIDTIANDHRVRLINVKFMTSPRSRYRYFECYALPIHQNRSRIADVDGRIGRLHYAAPEGIMLHSQSDVRRSNE